MTTPATASANNGHPAGATCRKRVTLAQRTAKAFDDLAETTRPQPKTEAARERLAESVLKVTLTLLEKRGVSRETTMRVALGLLLAEEAAEGELQQSFEEALAWVERDETDAAKDDVASRQPTGRRRSHDEGKR